MYSKNKRRISVALNPDIDDRLEKYSKILGISKNHLINIILTKHTEITVAELSPVLVGPAKYQEKN